MMMMTFRAMLFRAMTFRVRHAGSRRPRAATMAVALMLLLAACAERSALPGPATPAHAAPATASLQTLIDDTLEAPSSAALERVLALLGSPADGEQSPAVNLHDPARTDRVHRLAYPGVRVVVLEAVALERSFLLELEVTAGGYTSPEGIGVGSGRDEVVAAYGDRLARDGDGVTVLLSPLGDRLRLDFADERVVRMVWHFYSG